MLTAVLAYFGGALTILSPCVLPVLPFVFARAGRPFIKSTLPMLIGMAATFSLVATLSAVGGHWAIAANRYGRDAALIVLAIFGVTLLFPLLAARLTQPLVSAGARLSRAADAREAAVGPSLLLGVATGLLWAPCAGPILRLILTGAALGGANTGTTLLLLAYAAGAASSLALALALGGRVFAAMKRSIGAGEWVRRGLGVAVLVAVGAIALGVDTGFLTRVSSASTSALEQTLLDKFRPGPSPSHADASASPGGRAGDAARDLPNGRAGRLAIEGTFPSLAGAADWINSAPLSPADLTGKVVLVDFWTYSCINCLRAIPYVQAWADKYRSQGLVVIGVHAPEFAFEKDLANVRRAVSDLRITYPVAVDNDYAIWRAFNNEYWPAHYFIDAGGHVRHHHFGEGEYDESERVIQQLLAEAGTGARTPADSLVSVTATGAEAASAAADVQSPETYVGYGRGQRFVSRGGPATDAPKTYTVGALDLNDWGFTGRWTIGQEFSRLDLAGGGIVFRFHARDLHLVLGPARPGNSEGSSGTGGFGGSGGAGGASGSGGAGGAGGSAAPGGPGAAIRPVRFRVTIDGAAPGDNRGADVSAGGDGVVDGQRLYQLIRQTGPIVDRTFEIRFLDPGVEAFAFTFG